MALSDAQVRSLLCRVRNPIHKGCFIVMYAGGLRIGEAVTLEISSVDKANQLLRVIGKGNKERCVPLPQPVLDELRRLWLTHRNPRWLFPARFHSKHAGVDTLHTTFREVAQAAGIKGVTAHCLRHSYATRLLENRFETRVVQILLGHANIATTTIYTHLTEPTRASLRALLDKVMSGL